MGKMAVSAICRLRWRETGRLNADLRKKFSRCGVDSHHPLASTAKGAGSGYPVNSVGCRSAAKLWSESIRLPRCKNNLPQRLNPDAKHGYNAVPIEISGDAKRVYRGFLATSWSGKKTSVEKPATGSALRKQSVAGF